MEAPALMRTAKREGHFISERFEREYIGWIEDRMDDELFKTGFKFVGEPEDFLPLMYDLGWLWRQTSMGRLLLYSPDGRLVASRSLSPWRPSVAG